MGWRESTVDVDLYADDDAVFRDVQALKERLHVSIEFARPEQFVPPLAGSESRHVFIDKVGRVTFHHYDPYAQLLSKVLRGFARDLQDAFGLISSGMVDGERFRSLVRAIPKAAYAKYPHLSPDAVIAAVDAFLADVARR